MLSAVRSFSKSWMAVVIIGLIIVSFAVFGVSDVFRGSVQGDSVVKAGSRTIAPFEFKREFDNYKAALEQQNGRPISVEEMAAAGVESQLLQELATREGFAEYLHGAGIVPSDKLLVERLNRVPAFFDQVSGRFDRKAYETTLAQNGLTTQAYERRVRDDLAEEHFATAIRSGLQAPRAYTALAAIYGLETRDISAIQVQPGDVERPPVPTDAQLTAFIKENAALLTRPEMRVLTIARFSPAAIAPTLPVDEAAVKRQYEFRKDTLSTPETRSLIQIPAKDQAAAARIAQRLNAGEDPGVIAKSLGVDVISYKDKPRTAVADPKIAAAAFQAPEGQVATVQGDLGLAVIQVLSVTPGRAVTLEEIRPQIEAEVRRDAATEKIYAQSQVYDDAHQGGASLADAARKAGAPVQTLGPVTAEGANEQGQPQADINPAILKTAFSLPAGGESDLTEAGQGEYFAVRVERVIPAAIPPLAEIKPELTQFWMMRELQKRLQARADALAARVTKGEPLDKVGGPVNRLTGVDRASAGQRQGVSPDLLNKLFAAKAGDVFTAQNGPAGLLVVKVDAVNAGDPAALARTLAAVRPQMTQQTFGDIGATTRNAARRAVKVAVAPNAARMAIGLEPIDPKAAAPAKLDLSK